MADEDETEYAGGDEDVAAAGEEEDVDEVRASIVLRTCAHTNGCGWPASTPPIPAPQTYRGV